MCRPTGIIRRRPEMSRNMGNQYGLAIFPNGDVLSARCYGVGAQRWNVGSQSLGEWVLSCGR